MIPDELIPLLKNNTRNLFKNFVFAHDDECFLSLDNTLSCPHCGDTLHVEQKERRILNVYKVVAMLTNTDGWLTIETSDTQ